MTTPYTKGESKVFRSAAGLRLDKSRCFEHLGAPEDWDDNIICSLFALSVNDETDHASSTLAVIPNTPTESSSSKSRIVDFGHSKPIESHDKIYGGWTEIEPKESQDDNPRINLLDQLEDDDDDEEENKNVSPKKRVQERCAKPAAAVTAEREKTENVRIDEHDQRLSDLCQSWFLAGQRLGIYLTKQQNTS